MKKEIVEYLDFEDDVKPKVGRPRLADKKTKKKSLIIASISFFGVILLLIFGYGTLFGFKNLNLKGSVTSNSNTGQSILVEEIKPLVKNVTLKVNTARKLYLTVLPASATNKKIDYESANEKVAVVDQNGKVVGLSSGSTTITARTTDGSYKVAEFSITVVKNNVGVCKFSSINKTKEEVNYDISCTNARIKEIQYKIGDGNYEKLLTKKSSDSIPFSLDQLNKKITLKVVYYPNDSKVSNYNTKVINPLKNTTKAKYGACKLSIDEVKANSAKYDISCTNASVTKIAYKIGNGSYVGIDSSNLANTVLFEESDVTRLIYFNVEYKIDGTNNVLTLSKSSIIQKGLAPVTTTKKEEQ